MKTLTNEWNGLIPEVSTLIDVMARLGKPSRDTSGVSYGPAQGLRMLSYENPQASLFFESDRVALIILVPGDTDPYPVSTLEWLSILGKPQRILPSFRGKNLRVHVYSRNGLAPTLDEQGQLVALELFPAMTPDDYIRRFYKSPPTFVK